MAATVSDERDCSLDASFSENDRYCYKDCSVRIHDNLIQCDLCNVWFHKKCASNKDQVLAEILASRAKSKIPFWRCQECFSLWRQLPGMFLNFSNQQKEITKLKKQVLEMQNVFEIEINALENKMKQNDNNTESLASEVKHLKVATSQLAKDPNELPPKRTRKNAQSYQSPQPVPIKGDLPILVLGSSLTRGLLQEKEPRAEVHCFPGITTVELARKLHCTESPVSPPEVVILHVGGNNLANGQDPDEAIGDSWFLVEQAKSVFPNSKIVISGILFRRGLRRKLVKYVNDGLNWLCQCLDVIFVDLSAALPTNLYKRDGIHLNQQGINTASGLLRNFCLTLLIHHRDKPKKHAQNRSIASLSRSQHAT